MDLKTYMQETGTTQVEIVDMIFAAGGEITQGAISQWLNKRVPAEKVLLLEKATGGQVSRYDVRPDIYPRED